MFTQNRFCKGVTLFILACIFAFMSVPVFAAKVEVNTTRRLLPTMPFLIGTFDADGNPDVCIVDRAGILETSSPLKYFVSIKDTRQTTANIKLNKSFTINIPNSSILAQMDYMGQVHAGNKDTYFNKLGVTGLSYTASTNENVNAPVLNDCKIVFECVLAEDDPYEFEGSEYKTYAANIVTAHIDTGLMTVEDTSSLTGRTINGAVSVVSADLVFFSGAGGDLAGYYKPYATGLKRYGTYSTVYDADDIASLISVRR